VTIGAEHGRPWVLVLDIDGVLTDGTVGTTGNRTRRLHVRDLDALARARAAGIQIAFLTGENADGVSEVVARCGGGPAKYGVKDKARGLRKLAAELGVDLGDICYVGDARRDVAALKIAGLGLVPADADTEAKRGAARVLAEPGGRGAVAAAVDLLLAEPVAEEKAVARIAAIRDHAAGAVELVSRFVEGHLGEVERLAVLLSQAIETGGTIFLFGNGGSAAMAQHAATELVGRFRGVREPIRAIALTSDTAVISAVANDYCFDEIFRRQIIALGRPGDAAVALSTSGTSANVLLGLEAAKQRGLTTALITGRSPDPATAAACHLCLRVPSNDTARIQEAHLLTWHLVCEVLDGNSLPTAPDAATKGPRPSTAPRRTRRMRRNGT
jgi:D-sedoheptulose 7-phosphate isomerase